MSCFIVNPRTVARIANFIAAQINMGYNYTNLDVEIPENFIRAVSDHGFAKAKEIYERLYDLNILAFMTRYGRWHKDELAEAVKNQLNFDKYDEEINRPRTGKNEPWRFQMLKSMQCFLYQCDESDEIREYNVYKIVKRMIQALQSDIIGHLPEYKEAAWE